jgi:GT2 family glycosyltransferase
VGSYTHQVKSSPVISIVVVNKNHGEMLDNTLQSYITQTFKKSELICIDGKSTDNSLSVLAKYPDIVLISEADKSGAEAFAKGITKARSKYIILGNSTDFLIDQNFVASAIDLLESNKAISLVFGKVVSFDRSTISYNSLESYQSNNFGNYKKNFSYWLIHGETFHEHACVIRREIFDTLFEDFADYFESIDKLDDDLFLTLRFRFHSHGFRADFIPLDVLAVANHENRISVDQRKYFLRHLEFYNVQMKQFRKNFIKKGGYKFISVEGDDAEFMGSISFLRLKLILIYLEVRGFLGNLYRKIFR